VSVLRAEPASHPAPPNGRLTVDRLADPLEVVTIDALDVGCQHELAREPHRHDYHELIWTRTGSGHHALDDHTVPVTPGTVTVIGRGQVHVFAHADGVSGVAVRFGEQLLHAAGAGRADPSWLQLYRRFARVLERDFATHHGAAHYADALAVPPAALSQALTQASGRSTKEHVTERVMIEAARLLRFSNRSVSEIAYLTGFGDPLYFSRAFKRHHGAAPSAFRDSARGLVPAR